MRWNLLAFPNRQAFSCKHKTIPYHLFIRIIHPLNELPKIDFLFLVLFIHLRTTSTGGWFVCHLGPYQSINKQLLKVGGYLADVLDGDENNFIKSVLNVINPKVTLKIDLNRHKNRKILRSRRWRRQGLRYCCRSGRDWLLAWWPGCWPRQGTPVDVRYRHSSICNNRVPKMLHPPLYHHWVKELL